MRRVKVYDKTDAYVSVSKLLVIGEQELAGALLETVLSKSSLDSTTYA